MSASSSVLPDEIPEITEVPAPENVPEITPSIEPEITPIPEEGPAYIPEEKPYNPDKPTEVPPPAH